MKSPRIFVPLITCVFLFCLSIASRETCAQNSVSANVGAASALEQEILKELNLARTRPAEYAAYLEQLRPYFSGNEYRRPGRAGLLTEEGTKALDEAISFLRAAKPAPALTLSTGMCSGARELVRDQSTTGATGHKGADGSFCEQRTQRFGSWNGSIGENLSYGDDAARERVLTLLIDDGFASRGHRKRLLDPTFKVAGIACGNHKLGAMCVITLVGDFTEGSASPSSPKRNRMSKSSM